MIPAFIRTLPLVIATAFSGNASQFTADLGAERKHPLICLREHLGRRMVRPFLRANVQNKARAAERNTNKNSRWTQEREIQLCTARIRLLSLSCDWACQVARGPHKRFDCPAPRDRSDRIGLGKQLVARPKRGAKRGRLTDFGHFPCLQDAFAPFPKTKPDVVHEADLAHVKRCRTWALGDAPRFKASSTSVCFDEEPEPEPLEAVVTKRRKFVSRRGTVLRIPTRYSFYSEAYQTGDWWICRTALGAVGVISRAIWRADTWTLGMRWFLRFLYVERAFEPL